MSEKLSILIVDDNVNLCKTMSFVLKRKGYEVLTAKDGMEAIVKIEEKNFDLVFLDIKMPVMNGVETYKRIKKIRPDIIAIMMTAYSVEELIQEALEEGAYDILYKPLDLDKAISLIERAVERRKGGFLLIVDDDLSFSKTMKSILTRKGFEIGTAYSGEEAIELAKVNSFDIILIDIKLPSINGLETYLMIKETNPEIVVIMITGYHQEVNDLVQEALQKSAYTCLYKPIDIEILLRMIERILLKKQSV